MNALTLERLDDLARTHDEATRLGREDIAELIDYARERAARELCEALLGREDVLWCDQIHGVADDYRYLVTVVPFKGGPHPYRYAATPTEAYLALADLLADR